MSKKTTANAIISSVSAPSSYNASPPQQLSSFPIRRSDFFPNHTLSHRPLLDSPFSSLSHSAVTARRITRAIIRTLALSATLWTTILHLSSLPSTAPPLSKSSCVPPPSIPPLLPPPSSAPPTLKAYAQWHATAKACMVSPTCHPKPPILLWRSPPKATIPSLGLGNQLHGSMLALFLAVLTRRLLFIHFPPLHNSSQRRRAGEKRESYSIAAGIMPACIDWRLPESFHDGTLLSNFEASPFWKQVSVFRPPFAALFSTESVPPGLQHDGSRLLLYRRGAPCPSHRPCLIGAATHTKRTAHTNIRRYLNASTHNTIFSFESSDIHKALSNSSLVTVATSGNQALLADLQANPHVAHSEFIDLTAENLSPYALARFLAHMLYRPTPIVNRLVERYVDALLTNVQTSGGRSGTGFVGVHVRTGEDVGEGCLRRFRRKGAVDGCKLSAKDVVSVVADCVGVARRMGESRMVAFLAADSMRIKKAFRNAVEKNIPHIQRVHMVPSPVVHVGVPFGCFGAKMGKYRGCMRRLLWNAGAEGGDGEEGWDRTMMEEESRCDRFRNVFVDLYVLSRSRAVIMTGSTFAMAGYALGESNELWSVGIGNKTEDNCGRISALV